MKELKQKRGIEKRNFNLKEDKLCIEYLSVRKQNRFTVELDQIGTEIIYQSDNTLPGKIMLFICIAFPILITVGPLLSGDKIEISILVVCYLISILLIILNLLKNHQDDIIIAGPTNSIFFYRASPHEETVQKFVDEVLLASKQYKRSKYAKVDATLSEEQFASMIVWLKSTNVITEKEAEELKAEYSFKKLL